MDMLQKELQRSQWKWTAFICQGSRKMFLIGGAQPDLFDA